MGKILQALVLSASVFAIGTIDVRAEIFTANLSPAQEVPPSGTAASGYARVDVNESAGTLTFTVVFNNLSSAQVASHIHAPAPIGSNAPVAINFGVVGGTSGTITGTAAITPAQLAQLRAHQGYVNVHSVNFSGGEIRGQLGVARPIDNDGDGRTDLSVLRFPNIAPPGVSQITYWNKNSGGTVDVVSFGDANTDFPAPGDYDGDAKNDIALYRAGAAAGDQSKFYLIRSSDFTIQVVAYGVFGDQNISRDYDGDGITNFAVFRRGATATAQATWWIKTASGDRVVPFGVTGNGTTSFDSPVPGDYDGDGKFDIAVYRFGTSPQNSFIVLRSSDSAVSFRQWGNFNTDYIAPGDFDGDGKFDYVAVRTGATGTSPMVWWILQSSNGASRVQPFGISSDTPAQGDYDGDARTDIAVYRGTGSNFWIFNSFTGTAGPIQWGSTNDFAVNTFDAR